MIAMRQGRALATKTMILEQDCVTVLLVAAFSNFPPCATYVLMYVNLVDSVNNFISLILEFKTLLRNAHNK